MMLYVGIDERTMLKKKKEENQTRQWRKKGTQFQNRYRTTSKKNTITTRTKKEKPILYKLDCIDAKTGRTVTSQKREGCEQSILEGNVFDIMRQPIERLEHLKMMAKEIEFKFKMPSSGQYFAMRLQLLTKKLKPIMSLVSTPFLCRGRTISKEKKQSMNRKINQKIAPPPFLIEKLIEERKRKHRDYEHDIDQKIIMEMGSAKKKRIGGETTAKTPIYSSVRKMERQTPFEGQMQELKRLLEQETDEKTKREMKEQLKQIIQKFPSLLPQQKVLDTPFFMTIDEEEDEEKNPFESLILELEEQREDDKKEEVIPDETVHTNTLLTEDEQERYNGVRAYLMSDDEDDLFKQPMMTTTTTRMEFPEWIF
mmetsp:Transcript_3206/g.4735  ORF Transcript_3206/g.4735 Transcript_3206/m.4735 type:complete len:368 (+) Transcript_3206:286-1389(+)